MTQQNSFILQTQLEPLYKITGDFLELLEIQTATNEDGVADQEELSFLKDTLESKRDEFEEKVLNTGKYVKNIEAEIKEIEGIELAWKERLENIQREISKRKNKVKRLKEYIHKNMELVEIDKIESLEIKVTINQNGGKLPLEWTIKDMVELNRVVPEEFKKSVIDEPKVRQALDDGQALEFAKLGERGTYLRIR